MINSLPIVLSLRPRTAGEAISLMRDCRVVPPAAGLLAMTVKVSFNGYFLKGGEID